MARFNEKQTTRIVNRAGGEAYKQTPELELVSHLLTSFVKDQFYRSADDGLKDLASVLGKVDPEFAAKAAIYARNEFGMRSVTHYMAYLLGPIASGQPWAKSFYNKIVFRVDDMLEIAALFKGKLPNAAKKGFCEAFKRFDAYQLAKYKSEGKAVSLVDLVNLIHPVPSEKNGDALGQLVRGELKNTETWEAKLSAGGGKDAWAELLKEGKLGYLALIRNLRNIEQAGLVDLALEQITNREAIKRSKIFPFQIDQAMTYVTDRKLITALTMALEISLDNCPKFEGKTCVVLDESGSMTSQATKLDQKPFTIASLFAAVLCKTNDADLVTFDNYGRYRQYNPLDTATTIRRNLTANGGGTDFKAAVRTLNKPYDRIIFLSDMQGWVGYNSPMAEFNEYKRNFNCSPLVYSFDLTGYGDTQFSDVYCISGFSHKVFDLMQNLEADRNAMVNTIQEVEL